MARLGEAGLIHAVDVGELRYEEVEELRAVCNRSVLLARLADAPLGLARARQLLIHLARGRLGAGQYAYELRVVQQVALATCVRSAEGCNTHYVSNSGVSLCILISRCTLLHMREQHTVR